MHIKRMHEMIEKLTKCAEMELEKGIDKIKDDAYEIINKKGATYYGIGMCLVRITNAILDNENSILTVSTYDKNNDVFIGLPTILNKKGVEDKIYVNLNEEETKKLQNSIDLIKEAESISLTIVNENIKPNYVDFNKIKSGIRDKVGKYFYQQTECKPMILIVMQEV